MHHTARAPVIRAKLPACAALHILTLALTAQTGPPASDPNSTVAERTKLHPVLLEEFIYDPEAKARADAEAPAKPTTPSPPETKSANPSASTTTTTTNEDPIVMMEPFVVTAQRSREIQKKIEEADALLAKAERKTVPTRFDEAVNPPWLKIPLIGGMTSEVRAQIAQGHLDNLHFMRVLLTLMQNAKTPQEYARYERMYKELRYGIRINSPKSENAREPDSAATSGANAPAPRR